MSQCEKGINCLECSARGMCNSYAQFKYEQGRVDAINEIEEELKEVRHCLQLAKEQMLIDYVFIACEHLDNIEQLKEKK